VVVFDAGQWQRLERGGLVLDEQFVRTGADGRVVLSRNMEQITLARNSQIVIRDHMAGGTFTTVFQDFGTVEFDVERRNVEHFAVQTRLLAAVVKGTRFVVRADANSSDVEVMRGIVGVTDLTRRLRTDIVAGQTASTGIGESETLAVEGEGHLAAITDVDGSVVSAANLLGVGSGNGGLPSLGGGGNGGGLPSLGGGGNGGGLPVIGGGNGGNGNGLLGGLLGGLL
jgi:hypothetical protein